MELLSSLPHAVASTLAGDELFDAVPDTVFFVKDREGRYTAVNRTLVERTGRASKADLLGRTADEVFPGELGRRIAEQDDATTRNGHVLVAVLELHLYPNGSEGWCLTWKAPMRNAEGEIVGLLGMSRDVQSAGHSLDETRALSDALDHARRHLHSPLRVSELAARAGLSSFRFGQRIRQLFGMSASQYLTRLRIDFARDRLRNSSASISEIAMDCGYADQTAFSRQFRQVCGISPKRYRAMS